MFKQGRFNKINFTFTKNFKITYFACRISRANKTTEIPLNITTKKVYYINPSGDRIFDDQYLFTFPDLDIGDILEYSYKAEIAQSYGNEQFYFQDCFPKINMHLAITVMAPKQMVNAPIIFNNNIDSAYFTRNQE